jgi:hypothetical protein
MDSNLCQNFLLDNFDSDELESVERRIQNGISTTNLLSENLIKKSGSIKPDSYIAESEVDMGQSQIQSSVLMRALESLLRGLLIPENK